MEELKLCGGCGVPEHLHGTACGWLNAHLIIEPETDQQKEWANKWKEAHPQVFFSSNVEVTNGEYSPSHSERDWAEDFGHENGNYVNKCFHCDNQFFGHKRRVICKTCSLAPSYDLTAEQILSKVHNVLPEYLKLHIGHSIVNRSIEAMNEYTVVKTNQLRSLLTEVNRHFSTKSHIDQTEYELITKINKALNP